MDLSNFREEYLKGQLHRKDLAENPFEQFQTWFEQALKADIPEPNAFSLATADAQGRPSLRTVLLKYFDRTGFVFFTNYGSHKARDIEENPQVCMMLPWVMLERQIIIYGKAVKVSRAESLKYFLTRPKESQLGAWVSHQSSVISGRKLLEMKLMELKNNSPREKFPFPPSGAATESSRTPLNSGRAAPAACMTVSCTNFRKTAPGQLNAFSHDRPAHNKPGAFFPGRNNTALHGIPVPSGSAPHLMEAGRA